MTADELLNSKMRAWAPPPRMTVSEWADRFRFLSPESGASAGRWHTLPFQREIFDAFSDPAVHSIVVMSATQLVKTELILNCIGYAIDRDPGPMLLIVFRDSDADTFSKIRLAPMIRDTACLRGKVLDAKLARTTSTLNYKSFPGGHLTIAASGSPGNLSALPIRYLFADEIDKYPASAGSEGDPISLALKRTSTYWNRKVVLACSPTIDSESRIQKAFASSDQREYFVSCHACGESQMLAGIRSNGITACPRKRTAREPHITSANIAARTGATWSAGTRSRTAGGRPTRHSTAWPVSTSRSCARRGKGSARSPWISWSRKTIPSN